MSFQSRQFISAEALIWKMPGLFLVKDTNLRYLRINENFSRLAGYFRLEDSINKTDFDLPCQAMEFAESFQQQDHHVMEKGKTITLDVMKYANDFFSINLHEKVPLYDPEYRLSGIMVTGIQVSQPALLQFGFNLINTSPIQISKSSEQYGTYLIQDFYPNHDLTTRESECLYYFLRGYSAKSIAAILCLSPKTIQSHLEKLKSKLNCHKKDQFIEKAYHEGLFNFIPKSIFSAFFNEN